MPIERRAVFFKMSEVFDVGRCLGQQFFERMFSIEQTGAAQVHFVQVEQIKRLIYYLARTLPKFAPQRLEIWDAVLARHNRFAINDGLPSGQMLRRSGDVRELLCPVQPLPRIHCDFAVVQMQLRPVPVELGFMNPFSARRRVLAQRRIAKWNDPGYGA